MGSQAARILRLAQKAQHRKTVDNHANQKTLANLLEYVGTSKRRIKNPESQASLREHTRLDALITTQFEDLSTLNTRDRRWFRRPKEVLFTEPIEYKQLWLESVRLARARYARRRHTSTQAQRALMRSIFRYPSRPRTNQNSTIITT